MSLPKPSHRPQNVLFRFCSVLILLLFDTMCCQSSLRLFRGSDFGTYIIAKVIRRAAFAYRPAVLREPADDYRGAPKANSSSAPH
jgi:hypothetical protein